MSRLVIELSTDQHQLIKTLASMRGKTIKEFVLEQLFPLKMNQKEQRAWSELQAMLGSQSEEENKCP